MYFLDDIYFSWVSSTPATPLTSPVLTNKVDLTMECIGCGNSFTPGKSTQLRCKPNCKGKPVNSGQCAYCAKAFTSMDPRKKYCSKNCQHAQYKKSFGISGNYPGISTGTVGAISELRVCVDLLAKGYEVFRAVSPSCSCDLIAFKNGASKRVEVRTGYKYPNGKIVAFRNNRADVLAIVLPDEITYQSTDPMDGVDSI